MQQMAKRIVSVWLPHWPIERLIRHSTGTVPADRPFALVASGAHGLSITAINACAARDGVRVGASLADTRAALPELLSHPAEPARDQRSLLKLARWLGRYGPARNREGADGVWIDITGVAHLFGGEDRLLADLIDRLSCFGITARAGLAGTLGAAHALARFTMGQAASTTAPPDREKAALAALPVEGLRLAPDTVLLLKRLGLRRIGQLYDVPRAALEHRFRTERAAKNKARDLTSQTEAVLMRLDQALGLKQEPLRPLGALPALSVRRTWGEPLISAEALDGEIASLVDELCDSLTAQSLGVRHLYLTLYRADGTMGRVQAGFGSARCQAPHMMRLVREKMSALDAGFGIDMAVLDGHGAERTGAHQTSLGAQAGGARDGAMALFIDRLSNRLGAASIYCLGTHTSHIPERAQHRRPPGAGHLAVAQPRATINPHRPAFLLQPPEPVTVLAEVPEGIPKHFIWRRVRHRVVKGEGPERIEPEWWRGLSAPAPRKIAPAPGKTAPAPEHPATVPGNQAPRDYYRLEDEAGAHFWLFREGCCLSADAETASRWPPRWFVHGLFG